MTGLKFLVQGKPALPLTDVQRITSRNEELQSFWSKAQGWAPPEAAALLSKSRLDWQVSLSKSLERWTLEPELTDGDLILAWANLGSLIEGTLKLFLAVWYEDYKKHVSEHAVAAVVDKKGNPKVPDGLMLDKLIQYFTKAELLDDDQLDFVGFVRDRRNAIHAFKDRDIGDKAEFVSAVASYRVLLDGLHSRLPYPF